jgi:hypothetical protein
MGPINCPGAIELQSRQTWCREPFSTEWRTRCLRSMLLNKDRSQHIFKYIDGWCELPLVGAAGAFENGSSSFSGAVKGTTSISHSVWKLG